MHPSTCEREVNPRLLSPPILSFLGAFNKYYWRTETLAEQQWSAPLTDLVFFTNLEKPLQYFLCWVAAVLIEQVEVLNAALGKPASVIALFVETDYARHPKLAKYWKIVLRQQCPFSGFNLSPPSGLCKNGNETVTVSIVRILISGFVCRDISLYIFT